MDEVTKLWRVRKTVFQMLRDRGYHVAEKNLEEKKEDFEVMWKAAQEEGGGREPFLPLLSFVSDGCIEVLGCCVHDVLADYVHVLITASISLCRES